MAGCAGSGNMAGCAGIGNMAGCAGIGCADCMADCVGGWMAGCAGIGSMASCAGGLIRYTAKIAAPCINCRQGLPVSWCHGVKRAA